VDDDEGNDVITGAGVASAIPAGPGFGLFFLLHLVVRHDRNSRSKHATGNTDTKLDAKKKNSPLDYGDRRAALCLPSQEQRAISCRIAKMDGAAPRQPDWSWLIILNDVGIPLLSRAIGNVSFVQQ